MMNRTLLIIVALVVATAACAKKQPPIVAAPAPPPASAPAPAATATAAPPVRVDTPLPVPPLPPLAEDAVVNRSLDDLNRDSPLKPVLFQVDSAELDDAGRAVAGANAEILKKNPAWVVTIEGHCDERGTAEYNLALGERRALAAKNYLVSLGIPADKVKTVSYGKEFPFDAGHDDGAWSKNRRAHFVITAK
jgi:peptidoglycan-associated lipoprotein